MILDQYSSREPTRVVVLGGGFAGASCAHKLMRLGGTRVRVTLVDRNNFLLFSPLLVEAGTGSIEPRHAVVPLRDLARSVDFRMGEVEHIDIHRKQVRIRLAIGREQVLEYDHLVLALGSVTRLPDVPGLRQWGFQVKSIGDAVALRDRAIQMLELADVVDDPQQRRQLLSFVVVGGNYTGVEVAGEMQALLQEAADSYRHVQPKDIRVTLVDIADRMLNTVDDDLADYAHQQLVKRGMDMRMNTTVQAVHADHVELSDGDTLPTRTTIWCAGVAPNPVIEHVDLPTDRLGYIACEPDLRVKGFSDIWAIGDCASNPDPTGKPYAPTAQHAVPMGQAVARGILDVMQNRPTLPFVYRSKGFLAPLGYRTAVAKIGPFRITGFWAWFLWRTIYLLRMPGIRRKVHVALDWLADLLFGHDPVQLGVHQPRIDTALTAAPTA